MRGALVGFVLGAASTAAAFLIFGSTGATSSESVNPSAANAARSSKWGASPFAAAPASTASSARGASFATMTLSKSDLMPTAPAPSGTPIAGKSTADATADAKPASAAGTDADASGKSASDDSARDAPFLTDDYSRAIAEDRAHPRSPSQWHDDFTAEARDAAWAPNAERQLTSYFGNQASRGITLMGAQCHETMCELKLTEPQGVPSQFYGVIDDWYHTHRAFGFTNWVTASGDNGQRYIVLLVRRWPPKS